MPIFAFTGSLTRPAPNYGEANGRGITSFRFDDATGAMEPIAEFNGIDDANWLCLDVARRRLYAAYEIDGSDQSWVASFAIGADGSLSKINHQPTGGQTVCHMSFSPDKRFLVAANYNAVVPTGALDGAAAAFPIGSNGELLPASAMVTQRGTGPNAGRQERSHSHCAMPSPDGKFLYVADLGIDKIVVYALGADGGLTHRPESDFSVSPGLGPRHLAFSADGRRLFMVSELIATVLSFHVDPATGALRQADSFAIRQTGEAIVQPSGILRSADGFVFAELRQCNEIIGLAADPATGKLTQTGRWPSGGRTPRDFAFSPGGKHLLVANQDSDLLTVFPVSGGVLGKPVQQIAVGTPMAIALAVFPAA